jgi:mannose-6-phosphate isomerase-like protein (cupin superfamily)
MIRKFDAPLKPAHCKGLAIGVDGLAARGSVDYSKHLPLTPPRRSANMTIDVGGHLKAVRIMYGLSQRELAKRAGVTNGTISLIEQNRVSPSVSSLKKVLDGIPMSLAEFFTLDLHTSPQVFYSRDELTDLGDGDVSLRLVAAKRPNRSMSIMHERYKPGADTGEEMLSHKGEEGGVVLSGRIELTVGGQVRVLAPGDAYYFLSTVPHRFHNPGSEPCEIISASTPPSF